LMSCLPSSMKSSLISCLITSVAISTEFAELVV
jgi:hypothetical protein